MATYTLKCKLCGHRWEARKPEPKSCPNCKRYDWNGRKIKSAQKNP